jgi:hypothetical protein
VQLIFPLRRILVFLLSLWLTIQPAIALGIEHRSPLFIASTFVKSSISSQLFEANALEPFLGWFTKPAMERRAVAQIENYVGLGNAQIAFAVPVDAGQVVEPNAPRTIIQQRLEALFMRSSYKAHSPFHTWSKRTRLNLIADSIALILQREDRQEFVKWMRDLVASQKSQLLPDIPPLISSYLAILNIQKPTQAALVVGAYAGQEAFARLSEYPMGEDALREQIQQLRAVFGLNPLLTWRIIYVIDGDDRKPGNRYREKKTSKMAQHILETEFPDLWNAGCFRIYEFTPELKTRLRSAQGGAIVYGMRKAVDQGADVVLYTTKDLDIHLAFTGGLIEPLTSNQADFTLGSARVEGGLSGIMRRCACISAPYITFLCELWCRSDKFMIHKMPSKRFRGQPSKKSFLSPQRAFLRELLTIFTHFRISSSFAHARPVFALSKSLS